MVKKLKVVDVDQAEEVVEEKPIEIVEEKPVEVVEDKPVEVVEEIKPVEEVKPVDEVKPVTKTIIKPKGKQIEEITCENCNKKMLMKTYKYSHQKLCKSPPAPIPAAAKVPNKQPDTPFPQESNINTVSFDVHHQPIPNGNAYLNSWTELRQQRQMVRQQRVKSLISQAI